MRVLYLDCFCGISGDMSVGALIDAGADFAALEQGLASLKVKGFSVAAEKVKKKGITATQFRVLQDPDMEQPHRHLRHIVKIIEEGDLPEAVKAEAIAIFDRIAEAEATVHGSTKEKVHFHEVGAIDSIVDIVGACYAKHLLGVEKVYASALHVGFGTVRCDHGVMPVPAPATARLLKGAPSYSGEVKGELVTPTGAAIAAQWAEQFGGQPRLCVEQIGYGSGTRELEDRANVLRVLIGEMAEQAEAEESILVIETLIDDMNPEFYPALTGRLLKAGAKDVYLTAALGKKGRPAQALTILCEETALEAMSAILFKHSTTFGLRMRREARLVLDRSQHEVKTPFGAVRVKAGNWRGARIALAPEYESCREAAEAAGASVQEVYEAAVAAALKQGV